MANINIQKRSSDIEDQIAAVVAAPAGPSHSRFSLATPPQRRRVQYGNGASASQKKLLKPRGQPEGDKDTDRAETVRPEDHGEHGQQDQDTMGLSG